MPFGIKTPLYSEQGFQEDLTKYRAAHDSMAKEMRDRMIYGLMADIEYSFREYENTLYITTGRFGVGSDFLELGLTTAATLGNGNRTKTILSALGSAAAGTRLSIDKNFFRQRTFEALVNAMEAKRAGVEKRILTQLQAPVEVYPFEAALKDLREYFFAGTLEGGLTELQQESAASKGTNTYWIEVTKKKLAEAASINRSLGTMSETNDYTKLRRFLRAMGQPVDDNTPADQLQQRYRALAHAAVDDPELMKKMTEALKAAGILP